MCFRNASPKIIIHVLVFISEDCHPNTNDGRRVYMFWSEIQNYIAEADADLIPVPGQSELHGRCRCGVLLSPCFGALYLSQI